MSNKLTRIAIFTGYTLLFLVAGALFNLLTGGGLAIVWLIAMVYGVSYAYMKARDWTPR